MLWPELLIMMSAVKYLFSHSFCKAFDEDAAGYGRGEKAGIVIRLACTESKVE